MWALSERFEVRAVCDPVSHRAETAAAGFGAAAVDGFRVLTAREDIDAVLILGCQWQGSLPILAACDSGKAVYYGSALGLEPQQALRIKQRVQESGIAFMVELPRRQSPATLRLKELIATELGPPRLLFCHQRLLVDETDHPPAETSQRPAVVGGVVSTHTPTPRQELVELVDWCGYVVDKEPTWVTGMMHRREGDGSEEDYQMMSLGFCEGAEPGTGAVAQISCGRYIPARWREAVTYRPLAALQVSCPRGIAFVDLPSTLVWFNEAGRHQESLESDRPVGEQLLMQFYRVATSPVTKTYNLDEACRALAIVDKARISHRKGRRIKL